ncbi:MAG: CinA family nicotinamide mononucleotide deamidase-related protein [Desulfobacula sp.]|jgi:nicotinamide-nucleotide amidase|uniref:CinA family nicotinamide mononucleotide deamidase-related protein n=3 Tax=Desulfobacula sp. TaxID=2593537 RepID=UPI001D87E63F|nr:CinA family nicotinamide mononucleotide deamidase-related protein [Desulfobacula sp.]MBT3486117.1 CinA family nicotinamide mononucleotide deamidase-related protein [Desulfobacula sp.]MBT3805860.1 CinA family nicotinamide mononucleotide deamidase-related protein [Desulfobacula sp.]MBT4026147.1 CinA family nicotinamide mononucleotide deamidase-related protein [Desulfobacula sp.]MBT4200242.1 CinA family nicotinamide mononucleotide deamidase-related protein [Desulfobacula sp.]
MIAHILSTGDEVLLGDIVDTNSAFLCSSLKDMGVEVKKITAVRDDVEIIASTICDISLNSEICLVTGGLGPTQDDVTALACSKASGSGLDMNIQALASMKSYFKKRGFALTKDNEKQAQLPAASHMIVNHNGTAPGFYMKINKCMFFFMPGVPSEMKLMFEREIKQILTNEYKLNDDILIERLTVFGLAESRVGSLLEGFETKFPRMRLGFRADFPVIEVKIILLDSDKDNQNAKFDMTKAKQWAVSQLENKVVSTQGLSIAQEIGHLLTKEKKTLAVAESCTGGLISNMVTDVAGSSDYFLFSGITYSNDAKMNILNVQQETIIEYGAVHEQTALEMAQGARLKGNADYAISTTGIAGPGGGTREKPVGMVCIGLSGPSISMARTYRFSFGDRLRNKKIFAMMALELLRRHLVSTAETS